MAFRGGGLIVIYIILSVAILPLFASAAFSLADIAQIFFPHNSAGFNFGFGQGQQPTGRNRDKVVDGEDQGVLIQGYYDNSCPQAEKIVSETINRHFLKDPTKAPAIVRMFFHDCFVKGCDASLLLDKTPEGEPVEKTADHNGIFVRGYDVIDDIKAHLEAACPNTVSCADILAFANRDSLVFTGVPNYPVAAGRRDGVSSLASNVPDNLPLPSTPADQIIQLFEDKNITVKEMTALIGAHSIGNAHCAVVAGRFHDPARSQDMDPGYRIVMQSMTFCQTEDQDLAFDHSSSHKMDVGFFKQVLQKKTLLESDQNLAKDKHVRTFMREYVGDEDIYMKVFIRAMVKLGRIHVLTGNKGQIRKNCRAVNN